MHKALIVKGRLTGPRSVELDEAVASAMPEVEVLIHPAPSGNADQAETLSEFLNHLPAGTRSKGEIDQQVSVDRDSWGDR